MSCSRFLPPAARDAGWRPLGAVLAVALTVAGIQAVSAAPALAAAAGKGGETGPVSNAFAMGGGAGGSIDQRTGAFQASLPLVNVTGRAGTSVSLALSYSQSLAAQGAAGNRFGFGEGWSLGVPWVDTAGGVHVYPASGGSYAYDVTTPTGLAQYPLQDLKFAKDPGTIPPRPGLPGAQPYVYTLTYTDGTVDRFDANGNLVERVDRFGNPIDIRWRQAGSWWQPASVVDNYGQVTTFGYSGGQVTVTAPANAEKITATTTLRIDQGRLVSVTDPLHQLTAFGYTPVPGLTAQLLNSVTSPTGERTRISYSPLPYEPNVIAVSDVTVTNAANGTQVLATRHFDINPPGNTDRHNYTGYPLYNNKPGTDGLFTSGDFGYRYTTELSSGTSKVVATYNSLHLLVSQKVYTANPAGGMLLSQTQTYTYPTVTSVRNLPANYAKPTSVTVVYGDPVFGATRTVVTKTSYNDKGELVSATNAAGMQTTDTYFPNGLLATQTETGPGGAASITTDTLTADGKSIGTVTTAAGDSVATATARTVASYDYNGFGQVTGESVTWAKGAKPPGNSGGPDHIDDTQKISVDTAAHTQTDVVTTAAGTPQAAATTTVTDLVTGQVLSTTNPDGLATTYTYDALGRELTQTAPGGLTTRTAYNSPVQSTVTAPSGLETQTTTDVLGRTTKVTDNVSGEKLVSDPAARTVETDTYTPDGSKLTTTTPAGTTMTTFDPLGRPTRITDPGGISQTDTYNDVKNTQTVSLLPAGASTPTSVTTDGFSNLNQPVSSDTSYPDGTPQAPASESYDGLGRVTSFTANNVTAAVGYPGTGGLQTTTTLTPGDTTTFPGAPVTAATGNTMSGALTAKTVTERTKPGRATAGAGTSATGSTYTYDAAGQVATSTDQAGHTTRYTYTPTGQIATITSPAGTVTTFSYDKNTGRLARRDVRAADGATQDTGYTYYPDTGLVKSVYDPAHPDDAITYSYDADGHVTAVHYPDGTTTSAAYDDNGELAATTDVTGAVTTYTYNAGGTCGPSATDLCKAVQARDGTTLASVAYTYDSLNRVHTVSRGNGVTTTLAYTDASQVKTETTTAADGSLLRRDDYTYDSHGNVATHTVTSALPAPSAPGQPARAARRASQAAASAPATTTTAYGYDAYNRLISSATYPGGSATGTPTSTTSYTIGVAGDVTGERATTPSGTTTTTNPIEGGRLTARDVNGAVTRQDFDTDGNVTKDLAGNTYTFNPIGQIASVTTPGGITTSYSYWPDGTRRAATTTVDGTAHTITYHYTTTGQIGDDTYTGGGSPVTASYLMAVGREARTLTTSSNGAAAAQDSGPGTGYYLTDAHTSVTAMTGDNGQVTASYAYGDYGQPQGASPSVLPTPAAGPAGNAAVNPFGYDGAYTNPATGTQYLLARTYDPGQGRFLSLDAADQLNRYQAFNTNPIVNTDPTGQFAIPQVVTDIFSFALFAAFAGASIFATAGAAAPIVAAVAAGEEVAVAAIASAALNAVSAAANLGAAATSATLALDDAAALGGSGFLTDSQKEDLTTANFFLGTIAGVTGLGAGITENIAKSAEEAATALAPAADSAANNLSGSEDILVSESGSVSEDFAPAPSGQPGKPPAGAALAGQTASLGEMGADSADQLPGTAQGGNLGAGVNQLVADGTAPFMVPNPPIVQFDQALEQAGQAPNLTPAVPPFAVADQVPGNAPAVEPGTVPVTRTPDAAPGNGTPAGQLVSAAGNDLADIVNLNTPGVTPQPAVNPQGENFPPPAIGIRQNGLKTPFGPGFQSP